MALSPPLTVTFLGTGTSTGIPMIGCDCAVCTSPNPKDRRMRPSILVSVEGQEGMKNILVDTTPEMRLQMLAANVERVDAVLMTHTHADHLFGMDDIRQFNFRHRAAMPIYGTAGTLERLRLVFDYCFTETQAGGGKPQLELRAIRALEPIPLLGVEVLPLTVLHGRLPVLAFKFGSSFAYVTDVSAIPDAARPHLRGLDTLVLGTVRYDPHPTHFGLYQAIEEVKDLAPRHAYFTHLSHHFEHDRVNAELPPGIELAYDGLRRRIPADAP